VGGIPTELFESSKKFLLLLLLLLPYDQVIRENAASRGIETSAEVFVL